MEQDIHRLIKRFMEGLTSIEEESRIADYLRTHEVDEELLPYKRMFAWFDEGMPAKGQPKGTRRAANLRKLYCAIMAAAALALLLIVAWPGKEPRQVANSVPAAQQPVRKEPVTKPDTLLTDSTTTIAPKEKPRRHMRRDRFKAMPPKVYMAEAKVDSTKNDAESLAKREVREAEWRQEQILNAIYEEYRQVQLGVDLYIITMENYEEEEECY